MAIQRPSKFTVWELTEEEQLVGSIFTETQKFVLQNLQAQAAEEKLTLTFDPVNPSIFIQREAELQGQIGILDLLLARSTSAEYEFIRRILNQDGQGE